MIVEKAIKMAEKMDIPIYGLVENMSYLKCPDCGKEIKLFGESHIEDVAEQSGIELLGRIPIEPDIAAYCDSGKIEDLDFHYLDVALEKICK